VPLYMLTIVKIGRVAMWVTVAMNMNMMFKIGVQSGLLHDIL